MLIPYRPAERRVEVIKSNRDDASSEYVWITKSKNGISSMTLWSGEFGVEKIQAFGKND